MKFSVIAIAVLALTVHHWYHLLGFSTVLEYNDESCQLIGDDVLYGSEDLTVFSAGLVLVTSGDLHHAFCGNDPHPGSIGVVDLRGAKPTVQKVEIHGMPSDLKFQPHGFFFSNTTQRLYVISHGLEVGGGTRVFVFNTATNKKSGLPELTFVTTLVSPVHFFSGALNDIVEGSKTEIYATVWMQRPLPAKGRAHPQNFTEKLDVLSQKVMTIFSRGTHILRCELPDTLGQGGKVATEVSCSIASSGYYGANGITINPARDTIFMADPPSSNIHVLRRDATTGALKDDGALKVPYMIDNVEYDAASNKITAGSLPIPYLALQKMDGADVAAPGGLHVIERANGKLVFSDVILTDGKKLSQVSGGLIHGGHVLMGSPFNRGLLICKAV